MGDIKHTTICPHLGNKPTQLPPRAQHTHMALLKTLPTHSTAGWMAMWPTTLTATGPVCFGGSSNTGVTAGQAAVQVYGTVGTNKAIIYHLRALSSLSARKPP